MDFLDEVKSWIIQIAYISILAIIFELLIPSSSMKKYVKVVIGLTIMIAIINPVLGFIKSGININNALEKEYNYNNVDISGMTKQAEMERNKLIVDEYKKRLNDQIKERILSMVNASDVEVESSIVDDLNDKSFGLVKEIKITIFNDKNESSNNSGNISIEVSKANEKTSEIDNIKNDLSKFYNVPLKNITIEER
ncbi:MULTISPECIES: stage III sporulation protein AF [Thermoanaerobacterium]|uniref:Stage III sporulation protein AF n=2 Tax=Thermoanaerobacterium TaxID=28895 RepID=W9EHR5_9THEO|nr:MULTISPECIES: stage III sporulation protein AF [Thermoanaerobacterium]AFK86937.1 stage III sporulation protein AF [Thermoanaerobacterium saccharolyticum JW/SL-YS485]ETO39254.1 stage III sporulation protein AF [Thermoanaerobacterium aotearoense SCUT27]